MKHVSRLFSIALALCLTLSLAVPAMAQGSAPAAPAWIDADEYAVFSDGVAYESENWEKILSLREHAAAGNLKPERSKDTVLYNRLQALNRISEASVQFELGLLSMKYSLNSIAAGGKAATTTDFEMAASYCKDIPADAAARYTALVWNARSKLLSKDFTTGLEGDLPDFVGAVEYLLRYEQFTMAQILDWGAANGVAAEQLNYARGLIFVTLDGDVVHPRSMRVSRDYIDYTAAHIRNGRTMVPVRRLAELIGAVVEYNGATREITIQRADDVILLTLDSMTAYQNGVPFQMDVAPYVENSRTYVPIRFIAEFFSQNVTWNGPQQHVVITEDKTVAGDSNLESWTIAMGALLNYANNPNEAHLFGGKARFGINPVGTPDSEPGMYNRHETTGPDFGRGPLSTGWGISDGAGLLAMSDSLTSSGDAWNLLRVSHLAQWGYLTGYVTYYEALELVEPAAQKLAKDYSSWKAVYTDYLKGYCGWAGLQVSNVWQSDRGLVYDELMADPDMAPFIDDTLFKTGVIALPGPPNA